MTGVMRKPAFGLEVGGRVQYADPRLGLTVEGTVRGLVAHEDE